MYKIIYQAKHKVKEEIVIAAYRAVLINNDKQM